MADHSHHRGAGHHRHPGHVHPPASVHPSILRLSALNRLAFAAVLTALLWIVVLWALR